MPTSFLSPAELAETLGLSTSTLKRWSDKGLLPVERTAGRHRRIAVRDALRFVREARLRVVQPHRLGLPGFLPDPGVSTRTHAEMLFDALATGRTDAARGLIVSLFVAGTSPATLADEVIRPAFERIGDLWTHGPDGIATEHAATEGVLRATGEISALFETPPEAPLALGGAPSGDPYWLPSTMVALTLAGSGFRTLNLGADTPADALRAAVERHRPALVWLSLTRTPADATAEARLDAEIKELAHLGATLLVGGRAAPAASRHARVLASCADLEVFARGFLAAHPTAPAAPA